MIDDRMRVYNVGDSDSYLDINTLNVVGCRHFAMPLILNTNIYLC